MQIRQLVYFLKIVDSRSFNKASKELFVSQPTLSQSMQSFEEELGFQLLERTNSGIRATKMGSIVYEDAKRIIDTANTAFDNWIRIDKDRKSISGLVRLVTFPSAFAYVNNTIVKDLESFYPNLQIQIHEARGYDLPKLFERNQADLAVGDFVAESEQDFKSNLQNNNLEYTVLGNDTCRLAMSSSSGLSAKEDLEIDDIRELSLAYYSGGDDVAEPHFTRFFDEKLSIEFHSFEKIVEAASRGIAVCPLAYKLALKSWTAIPVGENLTFHTINNFSLHIKHCLIYSSSLVPAPAISTVRDVIIQDYKLL